jgi:hypothetical protein
MHEVKPASFICQFPDAVPGDVGQVGTEAASIKKATALLDLFRRAPSAEPCSP